MTAVWPKLRILHPFQGPGSNPLPYIPYSILLVGWCIAPEGIQRVEVLYQGKCIASTEQFIECSHPTALQEGGEHYKLECGFNIILPKISDKSDEIALKVVAISPGGGSNCVTVFFSSDKENVFPALTAVAAMRKRAAVQTLVVSALKDMTHAKVTYRVSPGKLIGAEALLAELPPIVERELVAFDVPEDGSQPNVKSLSSPAGRLEVEITVNNVAFANLNIDFELACLAAALHATSKNTGVPVSITPYFIAEDGFQFFSNSGPLLDAEKIKSVLVIKVDKIGDVLTAVPALRLLRQTFPEARLTLAVTTYTASIVSALRLADDIITPDLVGRQIWDVSIDLRVDADTRKILSSARSHIRASFESSGQDPYHFSVPGVLPAPRQGGRSQSRHIEQQIYDLASSIRARFDRETATANIEKTKGGREDYYVIFNPGPPDDVRCWPVARFASLAIKINKRYNLVIVVIGSGAEQERCREFIDYLSHEDVACIDRSGDMHGPDLIDIIKQASFFVGIDSGPKHLAAYFGVPGIVVHGGRHTPVVWGVTRPNMADVYSPVSCSPCLLVRQADCNHGLLCLQNISVSYAFSVASFVADLHLGIADRASEQDAVSIQGIT